MATYTPPPYFPQSSLAPPDENRYKKFKLAMAAAGIVTVAVLVGLIIGIWYFLSWMF
jgi:hypothetical protein